ncbi:MAG: hypothetical protein CME62_06215 [Halobacteriovoraceae bacterium]|nr:hypothetical protein [Halobacteriovoraceae bacterium]|tara:strand:+ start:7459 stop:7887 length:429 start_codon:yes stop_codon:yes gene_type:complete
MDIILLIHLITTSLLVGLIWTIQMVHYPSFRYIAPSEFKRFTSFHQSAITLIVGPLMLLELILSIILVYYALNFMTVINLLLVLGIWLVTIFISMPCHQKLSEAFHPKVIARLISTNWIRTLLWSVKLLVSVLLILQIFTHS